jgi:hypothetical protein
MIFDKTPKTQGKDFRKYDEPFQNLPHILILTVYTMNFNVNFIYSYVK